MCKCLLSNSKGERNKNDRCSSDGDIEKQNSKQPKQRGPSADIPLSDILNKASAVLYDFQNVNSSVFVKEPVNQSVGQFG